MPTLDKLVQRKPPLDLPEKVWREIEAPFGFKEPNWPLRRDVVRYLLRYQYDPPQIRRSLFRKWIKRIHGDAAKLLADLDWRTRDDESQDAWAQMLTAHELLSPSAQAALLKLLKELKARANQFGVDAPRDRGGKSIDLTLYNMITDLAALYLHATEQEPTITYSPYKRRYEGRFFSFVDASLRHVAKQRKSNLALGKTVQRVLEIWCKKRGVKD